MSTIEGVDQKWTKLNKATIIFGKPNPVNHFGCQPSPRVNHSVVRFHLYATMIGGEGRRRTCDSTRGFLPLHVSFENVRTSRQPASWWWCCPCPGLRNCPALATALALRRFKTGKRPHGVPTAAAGDRETNSCKPPPNPKTPGSASTILVSDPVAPFALPKATGAAFGNTNHALTQPTRPLHRTGTKLGAGISGRARPKVPCSPRASRSSAGGAAGGGRHAGGRTGRRQH